MSYILKVDTIIDIAHQLSNRGKKVVFTHGSFDLFHAGHDLFLEKSKSKGDILITGIEPDKNIKKYKSVFRPIINETHRSQIVASNRSTDFVFLLDVVNGNFNEYFKYLYKLLAPEVITYGKRFGFADEIAKRNKKIKFKQLDAEVTSTTKIISAIIKAHS